MPRLDGLINKVNEFPGTTGYNQALALFLGQLLDRAKWGKQNPEDSAEIAALHRALERGHIPYHEIVRSVEILGAAGHKAATSLVVGLLGKADWAFRHVAVRVLTWHWKLRQYADECVRMLKQDNSAEVREAAAAGLGALFAKSRDHAFGRILAEAASKQSEDRMVQEAAYLALEKIDGRDSREMSGLIEFSFPEDADDELIRSYLGKPRE